MVDTFVYFGSYEGVIDAIDEYLGSQEEGFYFEGINKLKQHWRKCIKAKEESLNFINKTGYPKE